MKIIIIIISYYKIFNFKSSFISDINEIIDEKNIFDKVNNILDLYNKINLSDDIYFKAENFNNKNYDINNIDIPNIEDIKETSDIISNTNIDSDNAFINKTIEINSDYMYMTEKIEDNKYKDFDILNMKNC